MSPEALVERVMLAVQLALGAALAAGTWLFVVDACRP